MSRIIPGLLLVAALMAQPCYATSQGPDRFADGTPVAEGANFVSPQPAGGSLPMVRYPKQLAVAGIQGHFEADVVVSASGDKTCVVLVEDRKKHPFYGKMITRSNKLHAHDEQNEQESDADNDDYSYGAA